MDKVSILENKGIYSFKIYSEQEELDSFIIDCKKRIVNKPLSKITSKILKIKPNNYNYYRKYLLSNHYDINFNETIWIPKDEDKCFILNILTCEVEDINYSKCNTTEYLKKNYLIFPTKELATKSMYFNHYERSIMRYNLELRIEEERNKTESLYTIFRGKQEIDSFYLNKKDEVIKYRLNDSTSELLGIEDTYSSYKKFLEECNFNLDTEVDKERVIWQPKDNEDFYVCIQEGQTSKITEDNYSRGTFIKNYYAFPNRELALKSVNLSKLERMQILFQYNNKVLYSFDFGEIDGYKYYLAYNCIHKKISFVSEDVFKPFTIYWKDEESIKSFIDNYTDEIEDMMEDIYVY